MNLFKSIAGFFIYIGSLAVPVEESSLELRFLPNDANSLRAQSVFEFRISDELTSIVNSEIPVIVKYTLKAGREQTQLYKILRKPITQSDYLVIDSTNAGKFEKTYPNIQLAVRNFSRNEWKIDKSVERIELTAEVRDAFVKSMNAYVDISPVFGGTKFVSKISVKKARR